MRIPDEQLDHFADLYQQMNVKAYGVPFHIFIQRPQAVIAWLEDSDARPLLLKQRLAAAIAYESASRGAREAASVMKRTIAELQKTHETDIDRRAVYRNGTFIEPLHHRAHPRTPRRA